MWELDYKENWAPEIWCFWTVVLEKTLESPLDCQEIQPVHSKGDQFWVFIGRTDAKAENPILWLPHVKSWLIGKDSDVWRNWRQEAKGTTEDEMAGWHHRLNGHEFEWTPGVGDGQGGLACWDSWGHKESDTTERLKWIELNWTVHWINAWKRHWLNPSKASKQTGRVSFSDEGDPKGSSLFPAPVPRFLGWKGNTALQLFLKKCVPSTSLEWPWDIFHLWPSSRPF